MIIENHKDVTKAVLSELQRAPNARFREIMSALVRHLHDFVRETGLTEEEFRAATDYINAIGGEALYSRETFLAHGIRLHFVATGVIEYSQFDAPFVPALSIIDLLMFNTPEKARDLLTRYSLA